LPATPSPARCPCGDAVDERLSVRAVRRLRGDKQFVIDPAIGSRDIATEMVDRLRSLIRAQWSLRGVAGSRARFAEKGVRIQYRRHCTVSAGAVIEQGASLRCLSQEGVRIGRGVTVGKFAILECTGSLGRLAKGITIGDRSSVGDYSFLGAAGGVLIGERVLMGQRVSIHSQNHVFADPHAPIQLQGTTQQGVVIEDDCWIGSGTIILDGVRIGRGSILSAGTVVTKDVPAQSIVAGVPGRVVGTRE
jgi:acetyltransferase-like isoleucine patch superfamily enzyme